MEKGNPHGLHSYEDVATNPEVRLGLVAGTTDLQYARDAGVPDDRIVQLSDTASVIEALRGGRIEAISGTGPMVQLLLDRTGDEFDRALPFAKSEETTGYGAFAVRKEDTDLLNALNDALAGFICTPDHLEIVKPFGVTVEELPAADKTADALCSGR